MVISPETSKVILPPVPRWPPWFSVMRNSGPAVRFPPTVIEIFPPVPIDPPAPLKISAAIDPVVNVPVVEAFPSNVTSILPPVPIVPPVAVGVKNPLPLITNQLRLWNSPTVSVTSPTK